MLRDNSNNMFLALLAFYPKLLFQNQTLRSDLQRKVLCSGFEGEKEEKKLFWRQNSRRSKYRDSLQFLVYRSQPGKKKRKEEEREKETHSRIKVDADKDEIFILIPVLFRGNNATFHLIKFWMFVHTTWSVFPCSQKFSCASEERDRENKWVSERRREKCLCIFYCFTNFKCNRSGFDDIAEKLSIFTH